MPSNQVVINLLEPYFTAVGIPQALIPLIWQAIEASGNKVVPEEGGSAVAVNSTLTSERCAVDGSPGLFLVGVVLSTGILAWTERADRQGGLTRGEPVYLAGATVLTPPGDGG